MKKIILVGILSIASFQSMYSAEAASTSETDLHSILEQVKAFFPEIQKFVAVAPEGKNKRNIQKLNTTLVPYTGKKNALVERFANLAISLVSAITAPVDEALTTKVILNPALGPDQTPTIVNKTPEEIQAEQPMLIERRKDNVIKAYIALLSSMLIAPQEALRFAQELKDAAILSDENVLKIKKNLLENLETYKDNISPAIAEKVREVVGVLPVEEEPAAAAPGSTQPGYGYGYQQQQGPGYQQHSGYGYQQYAQAFFVYGIPATYIYYPPYNPATPSIIPLRYSVSPIATTHNVFTYPNPFGIQVPTYYGPQTMYVTLTHLLIDNPMTGTTVSLPLFEGKFIPFASLKQLVPQSFVLYGTQLYPIEPLGIDFTRGLVHYPANIASIIMPYGMTGTGKKILNLTQHGPSSTLSFDAIKHRATYATEFVMPQQGSNLPREDEKAGPAPHDEPRRGAETPRYARPTEGQPGAEVPRMRPLSPGEQRTLAENLADIEQSSRNIEYIMNRLSSLNQEDFLNIITSPLVFKYILGIVRDDSLVDQIKNMPIDSRELVQALDLFKKNVLDNMLGNERQQVIVASEVLQRAIKVLKEQYTLTYATPDHREHIAALIDSARKKYNIHMPYALVQQFELGKNIQAIKELLENYPSQKALITTLVQNYIRQLEYEGIILSQQLEGTKTKLLDLLEKMPPHDIQGLEKVLEKMKVRK